MQAKVAAKALKSSKSVKAAKPAAAPKAAKAAKAAKPAKAPKLGKGDTVTLRHLGTAISETHNLPKKQANEILADAIGMIANHLKKGARIRIGGLGILQVKKRPARMGRNPRTGEPVKIKASKKVAFRAAKELKESV
ncbi:MAG: HU family DNA-binding protein [Hyphomicrobiaceae bacterium]|nr:HU family DNA-binding protein [Hyphomicrobiaceae bacterium]